MTITLRVMLISLLALTAVADAPRDSITSITYRYLSVLGSAEDSWEVSVTTEGGIRRGRYAIGGEIAGPFKICPAESGFLCLQWDEPNRSDAFFAVPLQIPDRKAWYYAGRTFAMIQKEQEVRILGHIFSAELIESRYEKYNQSRVTRFLFSPVRGLVGFRDAAVIDVGSHAAWESSNSYLIEGNCGFGASSQCQ